MSLQLLVRCLLAITVFCINVVYCRQQCHLGNYCNFLDSIESQLLPPPCELEIENEDSFIFSSPKSDWINAKRTTPIPLQTIRSKRMQSVDSDQAIPKTLLPVKLQLTRTKRTASSTSQSYSAKNARNSLVLHETKTKKTTLMKPHWSQIKRTTIEPQAKYIERTTTKPLWRRAKRTTLVANPSTDISSDPTLADALLFIAHEEFGSCDLTVAFEEGFADSLATELLIMLPHLKQVLKVLSPEDFLDLLWKSPKCRGYFFLFRNPSMLFYFMDFGEEPWDYHGRYVFVGLTESELNVLIRTAKGRKTEQIIGLVKDGSEWKVYMNQLFWGEGVTIVNRWREGRFTSAREIFPDKISDLKGATVKLTSLDYEPHRFIETGGDGAEDTFFGSDIDIARALSQALNFTLAIEESPKGEYWGIKSPNGSWNGVVGKVERNEVHFGLAFAYITNNFKELDVMDFSRFYSHDRSCFMARTEPPLPRWQSPAAPFRQDTWLVAFVSFIVLCPVLTLLAKASGYLDSELRNLQNFSYSNLYTWGMHMRIARPQVPKTTPTRIWVAFLWIYCIVLTISYNCNLITFLFVERPRASMETAKEIYSSDVDVLGVGFFFKESLKHSRNVYLQGLTARFQNIPSHQASFQVLERGEGVLIADNTLLEYLLATSLTEPHMPSLRIMKECFATHYVAALLQKHFPLKKSFDKVLASLFDQGLVRQWFLNAFQHKEKKKERPDSNDHVGEEGTVTPEEKRAKRAGGVEIKGGIPLGIDHMQGVFFIHIVGLALASVSVVLEIYCFKAWKK